MRAILTFIVVAAIAYFIALLIGVALAERFGMSNFEGAAAMQLAFVYAPAAAIVAAALVTALRVRGSAAAKPRRDGAAAGLRMTIAAVLLGYGSGWLVRWLIFDGQSFEQYWQAWIVSVLPYLGAISLGLVAYLLSGARKAID